MSLSDWPYIVKQLFIQLLLVFMGLLLIDQFVPFFSGAFILTLLVITAVVGVLTALSLGRRKSGVEKKTNISQQPKRMYLFALLLIAQVLLAVKLQRYVSNIFLAILFILPNLFVLIFDQPQPQSHAEVSPGDSVRKTVFLILGIFVSALLLGGWQLASGLMVALYLFLLCGFSWSFLIFAAGEIAWLERIAFGVVFSTLILPLSIFYLNRLGMQVSSLNVYLVVAGLSLAPFALAPLIGRISDSRGTESA